ncbi:MAG: GNAT family N-acetyltransferase [Firmicutes bacterium]|nr:GNAT family N-acetyltransferase [Bacillota bacterium]
MMDLDTSFDFARPGDYRTLSAMWQQCFGQTREDAQFFLKNSYRPGETLLLRDPSGTPVSMITLIPARLQNTPGSFLYAAATKPQLQSGGLMSRLFSMTQDYAASQGARFLCAAPSDERIAAALDKHGFTYRFYRSERFIDDLVPYSHYELWTPSAIDFTVMRAAYLQKQRTQLRLMCPDFILQELRHFGGDVVCFEQDGRIGYAAYTLHDHTLHIRECSLPFTDELGASLLADTGCTSILLNESGTEIPVGMYKALGRDPFHPFQGTMSLCLDQ